MTVVLAQGSAPDRGGLAKADGKPIPASGPRLPAGDAGESGHREENSPHKLRHTYATNLLNTGAELVDIVKRVTRAIATTQIYTNVGQERMEKVVARL